MHSISKQHYTENAANIQKTFQLEEKKTKKNVKEAHKAKKDKLHLNIKNFAEDTCHKEIIRIFAPKFLFS